MDDIVRPSFLERTLNNEAEVRCYLLTVTDGFSRYLFACQGLGSTSVAESKPVFTRIFKEYGLPRRHPHRQWRAFRHQLAEASLPRPNLPANAPPAFGRSPLSRRLDVTFSHVSARPHTYAGHWRLVFGRVRLLRMRVPGCP